MVGMNRNKVEIYPYQEDWPEAFHNYKKSILKLTGDNVKVGHFGSTSIKGMWAKPVIDIGLGVEAKDIDTVAKQLNKVSPRRFYHSWYGDDTVTFFCEKDKRLTHQIHIMPYKGAEWSHIFSYRDLLADNPRVAKLYMGLKLGLMGGYRRKLRAYTQAKHAFVNAGTLIGFEKYGFPNAGKDMVAGMRANLNKEIYDEIKSNLEKQMHKGQLFLFDELTTVLR